ncbi:DNA-processing protein DprA [Pseudomaricurvus alkylphenolicus]|uniref:DNA-processing protein DprA n=1 Tax=Pseudomaricurvus alkylphenolicus TaxID=1306991 RepID=UPI001F0EFC0E|nr:DNA-processing protein DprA [Pseudomaricurvus alkylphenolicus]
MLIIHIKDDVMEMEFDGLHANPECPRHQAAFLQYLPGITAAVYWRLHKHCLRIQPLLNQPLNTLLRYLPNRCHGEFYEFYRRREDSKLWRRYCEDRGKLLPLGVRLITHLDSDYPPLLIEISDPPPALYVRGDPAALSLPQLAVVGSRRASVEGRDNALAFSRFLAKAGIGICSGLALGIDTAAHQGALAGQGLTLAVLGTGIDRPYPARNVRLAEQIIESGGALVSEFNPGTSGHASNFPRRNRIISGLSLGVLVVEAALRSGSLITARLAMEQNREVFAIPGSIHHPLSRGCHSLIRDGATLVETGEDIAKQLHGWIGSCADPAGQQELADQEQVLEQDERVLWKLIGFDPTNLDQLLAQTGKSSHELLATLMTMELKGLIRQQGGGYTRLQE